ncbi:MAG TPA: LysE family translocator [Thermoleophilaceae bacterium]
MTPGQDTALAIRNTLRGGRRAGVHTALGVAAGQAAWSAATAAGLAALLLASEPAFLVVKVAGSLYLIGLGLGSLRRALSRRSRAHATDGRAPEKPLRAAAAFRQGMVSNLGNPKMAVFFTSLLPQFVGEHASFVSPLLLGLCFCSMTALWLSAYAAVIARFGELLDRPRPRRVLDAITGMTLVALGLRLAHERR